MFLTRYAITYRRVIMWVIVLILLAGTISYKGLPKAQDPSFSVGQAVILTYYPGATAQEVENRVTIPIEKTLQNLPGLDFVNSTSQDGQSVVYVTIKDEDSMGNQLQQEWIMLHQYMDMLESSNTLPSGVIGPVINNFFGDVYGSVYAITGAGYTNHDLKLVADEMVKQLGMVPGVGKVTVQGEQQRDIYIQFDMSKMANLNLNPYLVAQTLVKQNVIVPSGILYVGGSQLTINPSGDFSTVDQIGDTVIGIPGQNQTIQIKDFATVKEGYQDPPSSQTYYNGQPAVLLAMSLADGGNILTLGKNLNSYFGQLNLPVGIQAHQVFFEANTVKVSISDFMDTLIEAIVIVCASVILFIGFSGGILIAAIIPLTIFLTFAFMPFFGVSINQVSLAALIIALGILVDNGIVVVEGAIVKVEEGMDKKTAILETSQEVWFPLIVSTLCLSATFLPIFLSPTKAGQYTSDLFKVITITLICSWVLALTAIPMLYMRFLNEKKLHEPKGKAWWKFWQKKSEVVHEKHQDKNHDIYDTPVYRRYRSLTVKVLKSPRRVIIIFVVALIAVLPLWKYIPQVFFPASDNPTLVMRVELPMNASIYQTNQMVDGLNKFIQTNLQATKEHPDGVTNWTSFVGSDAPRFTLTYNPQANAPNEATLIINFENAEGLSSAMQQLQNYSSEYIPGATVSIQKISLGPPADHDVEIRLLGENKEALKAASQELQQKMHLINGAVDIGDDWGNPTPTFNIDINQNRIRDLGMSSQDIGYSLQMNFSGLPVSTYYQGDESIPIQLRGNNSSGSSQVTSLDTAMVYSSSQNAYVPLNQVASIKTGFSFQQIQRRSGFNCITVYCNAGGNDTPSAIVKQLMPTVKASQNNWKASGIFWQMGGDQENSSESSSSIALGLPITFLLIFTLLVLKFNSFRKPITLFAILPFSIIGVIIGLCITGEPFGFMTMLGVISLIGIILNHSIVLIDRIEIEMHHNGGDHHLALIESIIRRTRPVLITVLTAILGMIPLWLGGGTLFKPMAVAIIFGLIFEIFYIVILAPAIYTILYGLNYKRYFSVQKSEEE